LCSYTAGWLERLQLRDFAGKLSYKSGKFCFRISEASLTFAAKLKKPVFSLLVKQKYLSSGI